MSQTSTITPRQILKSAPPAPLTIVDPPINEHTQISGLCAHFINRLYACPESIQDPTSESTATYTLTSFIQYTLSRTRLPPSVTFAALILLQRLKRRFPSIRGASGPRLFITALMIASKVIRNETYPNRSWVVASQGLFTPRDITLMEREMCQYLDWNLEVSYNAIIDFQSRFTRESVASGFSLQVASELEEIAQTGYELFCILPSAPFHAHATAISPVPSTSSSSSSEDPTPPRTPTTTPQSPLAVAVVSNDFDPLVESVWPASVLWHHEHFNCPDISERHHDEDDYGSKVLGLEGNLDIPPIIVLGDHIPVGTSSLLTDKATFAPYMAPIPLPILSPLIGDPHSEDDNA